MPGIEPETADLQMESRIFTSLRALTDPIRARLIGMSQHQVRTHAELLAEFEANARAFVERVERDVDGRFAALRRAKAEAEATGSRRPIVEFVARLKAGEFDRSCRFPPK
jgi:hypothetical protein